MRLRSRTLIAALGLGALALPAVAVADTQVSLSGGTVTITATDADDRVRIGSAGSNELGPTTEITNGGDRMVAGDGCQGFGDPNGPANDRSVFCPTNDIQRFQVSLLGGDDEFENPTDLGVTIDAGGGDDDLDVGRGANTVDGGIGDDTIRVGRPGLDGQNVIDGGPDDDTILVQAAGRADDISGGPGLDLVSYRGRTAGVVVTLDGQNNDGGQNEGDNVRPDVENLTGTGRGDTLTGSDEDNVIDGDAGDDELVGLDGDDTLIGGPGVDRTFGGEGDDTIMLRDGITDACPDGGPGENTIDLDLADQFVSGAGLAAGLTLRRLCLAPGVLAALTRLGNVVTFRPLGEGPASRLDLARPAVVDGAVRVRLTCPAALRVACRGTLAVASAAVGIPFGTAGYRVPAGRSRVIRVPVSGTEEAILRRRSRVVLISSERGRSPKGPKVTIVTVTVPR